MNDTYIDAESFARDVVAHARGAWVNGTYNVAGEMIGIKAFGHYIQVMCCAGIKETGGDFRSQKAMRAFIVAFVAAAAARAALNTNGA